ncbi:GDSL esterase/lipase At5g41890 [Phoenix dactylifera]|uniref:GDSL esterase/lipase At5g41890 n=1 Tax=Phoenix dactylifera TaxID=42345 RepID=A0A8B8ZKA8_PHODC|nr:GDSL esterase/lipase At5g41890 [Phoenix dactylifera]
MVVLSLQLLPSLPYASFVFGDSLVDAGNNDYLFTLSKADSPPYGIDFAPSGGRPTGRFTNGRTISDIIGMKTQSCQAMGETSFPPPYLAPNTSSNILSSGINYASGSSGILDETGSLFIGRVPLRQQINYFEETRGFMVRMVGENAAAKFLKTAIFSVTSGSNDILNYLEPSIPFLGKEKVAPAVLQDMMVSNLTLHLKHLHQLGARKFIVVGIGPLGCIPYVRALMLVENGKCSSVADRLIQGYNMKLSRKINQLNQEMGPETIFVFANSYQIVIEIIKNYRQYGFENVNDPCCGGSFPPFLCFRGPDAGSSSVLCKDRSKFVFWDAYHPTEATNIIIAKRLLDGDASAAYPVNVRRLYEYAS